MPIEEIKDIVSQAEDLYAFQTRNRTHSNKYSNENRYSTKKHVRFHDDIISQQSYDLYEYKYSKSFHEG